jgi:hypothetical protein
VAIVVEAGRVHFHREARAVGAHVGDFDDVGLAAVQRFPHRSHVIARQLGIEEFDRLADDLFARTLVRGHAGLVDVQDGAVPVDDADRVGHGVEDGAVAVVFDVGRLACFAQCVASLAQQRSEVLRKGGIVAGQFERGEGRGRHRCPMSVRRLAAALSGSCRSLHVESSAFPALLPVFAAQEGGEPASGLGEPVEIDPGPDAQSMQHIHHILAGDIAAGALRVGAAAGAGDRGVDHRHAFLRQARMFDSAWP